MEFRPGLNIVAGPIATGKTTFLRMCRALLGGAIEHFPPEARQHVSAIAGTLKLADHQFDVVRPLVSTDTAKVEIAGVDEAWRLPASRPDATSPLTYNNWLLDQLKLPQIRVPSAPTRPTDSAWTPISINDYMLYCHIPSEAIDSSVFGHRDPFKNIKRQYVFELVFGFYDPEAASIQERLGGLQARVRALKAAEENFRHFTEGTRLENRTAIERQLEETRSELASLNLEEAAPPMVEQSAPGLRSQLQKVDADIDERSREATNEQRAATDMARLEAQLEAQAARVTKAIVTGELLVDYEFRQCPRCGSELNPDREEAERCLLCLQHPEPTTPRRTLVEEQSRISEQITETREILEAHRSRVVGLKQEIDSLRTRRERLAQELNFVTRTYVSDTAEQIRVSAARRAQLQTLETQMSDYLTVFEKLDRAATDVAELQTTIDSLTIALDQRSSLRQAAEDNVDYLQQQFLTIVNELGLPEFPGDPRAGVNRETYLPILNGRPFSQLSSGGLMLLVNVAFALAHHVTALDRGLSLPGFLMIDNITKNVGTEDFDWARVEDLFAFLTSLSESRGNDLQIVVGSNDVPDNVPANLVRAHLSQEDLLIRPE